MGSPLPTLAMIILYLAFVNVGPRIMKNREPLDMKPLLFVFNAFIVALNFWMAWEVSAPGWCYMYLYNCVCSILITNLR